MEHPFIGYARGLVARLGQSGWRPFWGWGGGLFTLYLSYFAFITVPLRGVSVPDGFYTAVLAFIGLYVTTFIARGVEKAAEQRAPVNQPGGAPGAPVNPHGGPVPVTA